MRREPAVIKVSAALVLDADDVIDLLVMLGALQRAARCGEELSAVILDDPTRFDELIRACRELVVQREIAPEISGPGTRNGSGNGDGATVALDELITNEKAANILRVVPRHASDLCRPFRVGEKVAGAWLVRKDEVVKLAEQRERKAAQRGECW
jgi:hypothetical protein